jgi:LytR cell envelope-related transcriptional attenuator
LARQHARRQQRERAAGVVVVCLGIVVLIVAVLALREPNGHVAKLAAKGSASSVAKQSRTKAPSHNASKSKTSATSKTSKTTGGGSAANVKSVPLVVLNNSTIKGLAAQAAQRFEAGGWKVTESGNLTNEIISTCAYYDESDPQAKSAAEALQAQYPGIKRVKPKFPELPSGPVVVVLTRDYAAA